jgi:hypothetical protein
MNKVESEISATLSLELDNKSLFKTLMRQARVLEAECGEKAVTEVLADLYPFFEDCEHKLLRAYLLNRYERHNNNPVTNSLIEKYVTEGILVFISGEGQYKTVHCNNKAFSRGKYPIQVSRWYEDRGVCGDALYGSVEDAIKSEGLAVLRLVSDEMLDLVGDALVSAEVAFQESYKSNSGEYRLN